MRRLLNFSRLRWQLWKYVLVFKEILQFFTVGNLYQFTIFWFWLLKNFHFWIIVTFYLLNLLFNLVSIFILLLIFYCTCCTNQWFKSISNFLHLNLYWWYCLVVVISILTTYTKSRWILVHILGKASILYCLTKVSCVPQKEGFGGNLGLRHNCWNCVFSFNFFLNHLLLFNRLFWLNVCEESTLLVFNA